MTAASDPPAAAYLVVFNTVPQGSETEFHEWYQREHLNERLGVPGFHTGRRYRAADGGNRYIAIYTLSSVAVATSPAYRQRLENPTPWTQKVMPNFMNMSRTFMQPAVEQRAGITGMASFLFLDGPALDDAGAAATRFCKATAAVQQGTSLVEGFSLLLGQPADGNKVTRESAFRPGGDSAARWVGVVEWSGTPDDAGLRHAMEREGFALQPFSSGLYQLLCARSAPPATTQDCIVGRLA
jgi:hypothetical protein